MMASPTAGDIPIAVTPSGTEDGENSKDKSSKGMSPQKPIESFIPRSILDRHVLGEELTRWNGPGTQRVFRAIERETPRHVVLKIPFTTEQIEVSQNEVDVLNEVSHKPHIMELVEYDEDTGIRILEFFGGGELADLLEKQKGLALDEIQPVVRGVVRGLRDLHSSGYSHQDIRVSSVMLDGWGEGRIADFKFCVPHDDAREEADGLTYFWPPEKTDPQRKDDEWFDGPAADMWAVGVLILELINGQRPFPEQEDMRWKRIDEISDPDDLNEFLDRQLEKFENKELYPALKRLLFTLLQFEPEQRMTARGAIQCGFVAPRRKKNWRLHVDRREQQSRKSKRVAKRKIRNVTNGSRKQRRLN